MSITHITSLSQLDKILAQSKDKLTVIDFHATWCGPCIQIAPRFEAWAKEYTNVNFLKCDVDQARDVASSYKVTAMPTFVFLKGSTKVDQIRGADANGILNALRKHSSGSGSSTTTAFSGQGRTLGGGTVPGNPVGGAAEGAGIDQQVKILAGLVGLYALFWYMS